MQNSFCSCNIRLLSFAIYCCNSQKSNNNRESNQEKKQRANTKNEAKKIKSNYFTRCNFVFWVHQYYFGLLYNYTTNRQIFAPGLEKGKCLKDKTTHGSMSVRVRVSLHCKKNSFSINSNCDSNIGFLSIAPCKVITLYVRPLLLICIPYSYHSPNYCNSNSFRS